MTGFRPILLLMAVLALGAPALAVAAEDGGDGSGDEGGVHEGLFATGVLDELAIGESIRFRHDRSVEPDTPVILEFEGTAEVALAEAGDGRREARVTLTANGDPRPVPPMPADAGHPLLLIFLESTVRTMAETAGGSPYYIRNRIRESFWDSGEAEPVEIRYEGETVAAEELVYHPFAEDPNRDRMGGFADLTLRFLVSDAVPGGIARFDLEVPPATNLPGVSETIVLEGLEQEEET